MAHIANHYLEKLKTEITVRQHENLPGPDNEDEKEEEDSFLELFIDEKDC